MKYKIKFIVKQIEVEAENEDIAINKAWELVIGEPNKFASAKVSEKNEDDDIIYGRNGQD